MTASVNLAPSTCELAGPKLEMASFRTQTATMAHDSRRESNMACFSHPSISIVPNQMSSTIANKQQTMRPPSGHRNVSVGSKKGDSEGAIGRLPIRCDYRVSVSTLQRRHQCHLKRSMIICATRRLNASCCASPSRYKPCSAHAV